MEEEAMSRDSRYVQWLGIADELVDLIEFVYGDGGSFAYRKNSPSGMATDLRIAEWIRDKCQKGGWYWWDKTTIAGKAEAPLRHFIRLVIEGGGRYEETVAGREMIARIERLQARINAASKN